MFLDVFYAIFEKIDVYERHVYVIYFETRKHTFRYLYRPRYCAFIFDEILLS